MPLPTTSSADWIVARDLYVSVYTSVCVWYGNDDHNRSLSKTHQQSQPSSEEAEQVSCVSSLPVLLNHRLCCIFKHFHSCRRKPHISNALYIFITVGVYVSQKHSILFYILYLKSFYRFLTNMYYHIHVPWYLHDASKNTILEKKKKNSLIIHSFHFQCITVVHV